MPNVDMTGVCDLHVHSAPCLFERLGDDIELAENMESAGYAAVVFKSHHESTVGRAAIATKRLTSIKVFGGLVLNRYVGGINPAAAESALYMGAKVIWMPSMHTRRHAEFHGTTSGYGFIQGTTMKTPVEPIYILDESGVLTEDAKAVARLVGEYDAILATAHLSKKEAFALAHARKELGLRKLLITHPHFEFLAYTDDELVELAETGAILELCSGTVQTIPGYTRVHTVAATIKKVGARRCIVSSDSGSPRKPYTPETTRAYLYSLGILGVPDEDLRYMSAEHPPVLLGLR